MLILEKKFAKNIPIKGYKKNLIYFLVFIFNISDYDNPKILLKRIFCLQKLYPLTLILF